MMYKTHIKIGQTLYIASIPVLAKANLLPNIVETVKTGDAKAIALTTVALGVSAVVGFHGASFGSGYPDIDHPTSTPAKKSPIIATLFQACGVKHRGRYSHSMDMITLTFLMLYMAATGLFNLIAGSAPEVIGSSLANLGIIKVLQIWIISAYIGAMSHLFADSLTKQGVRVMFFMPQMKLVGTKMNIAVVSVITTLLFTGVSFKEMPSMTEMPVIAMLGLVAFFISNVMYNATNSKGMKSVKPLLAIVFGAALLYSMVVDLTAILKFELFVQLLRAVLVAGFTTTVIPGIDFFKTGDDSVWEQLVRKVFTLLYPVSYLVVFGTMALQIVK